MKTARWVATVGIVACGLIGLTACDDSGSSKSDGSKHYGAKDACKVLTQKVADKVLGDGAEKGTPTPMPTTNDVSVSTCTYTAAHENTVEAAKNVKIATLMVRSPLSDTGADSNAEPFKKRKTGAETVKGYGDDAYWDPNFGQLNVLKKDTWFIISVGTVLPKDHTLADSRKLADEVIPGF